MFSCYLIQTFVSSSKTVTVLNGKILPGASDTTYRCWLKDNGLNETRLGQALITSNRNPLPTVVTTAINIELRLFLTCNKTEI